MSQEDCREMRTVQVRRICDCGGELLPEGRALLSNPPKYPHTCDRCGKAETFLKQYPLIHYEPVT